MCDVENVFVDVSASNVAVIYMCLKQVGVYEIQKNVKLATSRMLLKWRMSFDETRWRLDIR